jgi:putative ABC transport system substrate-binding protein
MKTRQYWLLLILVITTCSYAGDRQPRIVVLGISPSGLMIPQVRGLLEGLEELGYVDGKNINIEVTHADNAQRLRDHLTKVRQQKVDAIVATSANETALARQITSTIPIIFAPAIDPVGMGFITSRSRPNANLTGLSFTRDVEDSGKQLAVFKQVVPTMRNVRLFYGSQPATPRLAGVLASVKGVARAMGMTVAEFPARSAAEATESVTRAAKGTTDGIFLICSAAFRGMASLAERAAKIGAPVFGCTATQVAEEGALMTYAPDIYYIGYRSAWYVDRILKGATPADLPVEVPSKFELVINLNASRRMSLKIPPEVLIVADKVFQ